MTAANQPNAIVLTSQAVLGISARFADFESIEIGNEVRFEKTITAEDVDEFAKLSGDHNPLHMDEEFAARTGFHHRVAHGMLLASYVSKLVGMDCPGPGALWTQQDYRWPVPVFVGDRIQLRLRVTHKSSGARALTFAVTGTNQDGKVVMEGAGTVTVLEEQRRAGDVRITERVAFISEASSVLGAAIAADLAKAGAAVVVHYYNDASAAKILCSTIESAGGRALPIQADLTERSSVVDAFHAASDTFRRPVDLLVNISGSGPEPQAFLESRWDDVQSMLDRHLREAWNCCQTAIPGMVERNSGRIINIGSAFTRGTPPANWSSFLIAKSAMQGLTRSLAAEFGPHGIRVNMVSPGLVDTQSYAGIPERLRKVQAMQTPLRRLPSVTEIAAVISALCSAAGDFVTGAEIPVSGGLQM